MIQKGHFAMFDNIGLLVVVGFILTTVLYTLIQYGSVWSNFITGLLF